MSLFRDQTTLDIAQVYRCPLWLLVDEPALDAFVECPRCHGSGANRWARVTRLAARTPWAHCRKCSGAGYTEVKP